MPHDHLNNEKDLLLKLAAGEESAFSAVYRKYQAMLYLYAEKVSMKNTAIAQDVTAEAFIELWKGNRQFENFGHLISFLMKVVHNKCVDRYRQTKREATAHNELLYLSDEMQEDILYGQVWIEAALLTQIRSEVEKLPRHTKEVFKLSFFEGLKNAEIASRLNITDATVRRRKTEALHELRITFKGVNWDALPIMVAFWGLQVLK